MLSLASLVSVLTPSALCSRGGALALVLAAVYVLLFPPSRARRAIASLPRPQGSWPVLGATHLIMHKHRGRMHLWFYEEALRLDGAAFALDIPTRQPLVVISKASSMGEVLRTQGHKFSKSKNFAQAVKDVFGEGAFVAEGQKGLHQRRTTSHFFAPTMTRAVMRDVLPSLTRRLCAMVGDAATSNQEIDIKHLFELFATDVATSIGFGVDLRFMEQENREFLERFDRARFVTLFRQQQPTFLWKFKRWLRIGVERQQLEDVAWLDAFVYDRIRELMARQTAGVQANDILSLFLEQNVDAIDVKELRDMAMTLLAAGRKTTANALSWFMAMMVQYPDVQTRIRDELKTQIPELVRGDIAVPTTEQVAKLVYLDAALRENMRLNTVVPVNTRETVEDVELRDGTFLAKGTQVLLSWYGMSRLESTWGPDATAFKPERWIDATTGKLRATSQLQLIAFSAGRRVCPAKHFALLEMKLVLAALLSKFEISATTDPRSYGHDATVALAIAGPQWIRPTFVN